MEEKTIKMYFIVTLRVITHKNKILRTILERDKKRTYTNRPVDKNVDHDAQDLRFES